MNKAIIIDNNLLYAEMQTLRGPDTVDLRLHSIVTGGVSMFAQDERPGDAGICHIAETVGCVAMDPGLIYGNTLLP